MRTQTFWQVDAFTRNRYLGNAAAVVFESDGLDPAEMQIIARQMNLSETVFLCRPTIDGADYRARIFTPRQELPFAGHPTVAAAFSFHALMGIESARTLVQECGIGLVSVDAEPQDGTTLFTIAMGEASRTAVPVDRELAAQMLGCDVQDVGSGPVEVCSAGLPWMVVPVRTLGALSAAVPKQDRIERVCAEAGATGLSAYALEAEIEGCDVHVRSFAPGEGIAEDPACGSGNGAVAVHVAAHARSNEEAFEYVSEQGLEVGRNARLYLSVTGNGPKPVVRLGGNAVQVMRGELDI